MCNANAARARDLIGIRATWIFAAGWLLFLPSVALAQRDVAKFLAGAAVAFGAHEGGHVAADLAWGTTPGVRRVEFGPVPFFAITHDPVSPAREFTISSAGFWAQHLSSEIILTRAPRLRDSRAMVLKGMLAFNVLASAAYGATAIAGAGPVERDTRGMAVSSGTRESAIAAVILTPAVFDALRYYFPQHAWLRWVSRGAKVGGVLLVMRAAE